MWKGWEICKVITGEQAEFAVRSDHNMSQFDVFGRSGIALEFRVPIFGV